MNYVFSVRIFEQPNPHTREMQYQSLTIFAFNFSLELADQDRDWIKSYGLEDFLKNLLYDLLAEQESHGEMYNPPRKIETITKTIINSTTKDKDNNQQGLLIDVEINDYTPKNRRCNFFERINPWLVSITTIAEMALGSTLGFFWLEYSQGSHGIIPMNANTNFGISLSSSSLSFFWMLWDFFTNGQIIFMKDNGANMDKQCHQVIDKFYYKKTLVRIQPQETQSKKGKKIGIGLKFFFMLGFLNDLYRTVTSTYSSLNMTASIEADQLSIPVHIYLALNYLQIALDHIDDPIIWCSNIYISFIVIDTVIAKYWPAAIERMPASNHLNAIESQRHAFIKNRQALRFESKQHEPEPAYTLLIDQPREEKHDEHSLIDSEDKYDNHFLSPRQRVISPSY